MSRKRLWLALALGIALILLMTGSALAANNSLKFNMELSSSKFTGPTTITVSITVSNAGESDLPGPVTLYYPSGKQVEETLPPGDFFRCNSGYFVNLRRVTGLNGFTVMLGDTELQVSHSRKKAFVEALHTYLTRSRS